MTKSMYLNMNEKPNVLLIITRNIILSLLIIASLSVMEKLQASETHIDAEPSPGKTRLNAVSSGSLLFKTDLPGSYTIAPTLKTKVDMQINGIVLRATVTQTFKNESDMWVEGIYVFPLPENAAVDRLSMQIGERQIKGIIQERKKAKLIYLKAKTAGKKAALIEQQRPNMFTNSVANIAPHESITITIEFQQNVRFEKIDGTGQFSLRFPTTITPRYIPGHLKTATKEQAEFIESGIVDTDLIELGQVDSNGWTLNTDQVPDAVNITPPMSNHPDNQNRFVINIHINAGFEIEHILSPYHNINLQKQDDNNVLVTLLNESNVSDRDFVLTWKPKSYIDPKAAIFSQPLENENYHLLMLMPPSETMQGIQALAREVIYIIDTSGSMSGESMQQAKNALLFALGRLRAFDKFNIIQFDSTTRKLFPIAQAASLKNIRSANDYVSTLIADGGTEMLPALQAAMNSSVEYDNDYVRQILFLTDGAVGNENQLFSYIQQHLGNNRLFTVGIGSAPNSHFMTKSAAFGRGTFTYIGAVTEVQQKLEKLFSKLESPVLRNIELTWSNNIIAEAWPKKLPDLYLGEPLIVSIKTQQNAGSVTLKGVRTNEQWQVKLPLKNGKPSAGIAALWAKNKINALSDELLKSDKKQNLQTQITDVALRHNLVSQYTSLVAVDVTPTRPQDERLFTGPMPLNSPAGYQQKRLFGMLANTATSGPRHLILGCLLLLIVIIGLHIKPRTLILNRAL